MFAFHILLKNTETNEKIIQEVDGYKLPHGLFAYKEGKSWILSDVNSGTSVKTNIEKYSDIKPLLQNKEFIDKLVEVRKTERYKRKCETLESLKLKMYEPKEVSLWEEQ